MELVTRTVDKITVIDFTGNLDTGTAPEAEIRLNELMSGGATKLLVNLKDLDYISSAGLRVFLSTAKQLKSAGGELRLCHLNETVQEIFDISGFSMIFNVKSTEQDALAGF